MKRTEIRIPIYDRSLIIVVTNDIKKAIVKYCPEEAEESDCNLEATVVHDNMGRMNLMIQPDANINVICHEALHITVTTLDDAGMEMSESSEEAYAYLIGWVAEQIQTVINKY